MIEIGDHSHEVTPLDEIAIEILGYKAGGKSPVAVVMEPRAWRKLKADDHARDHIAFWHDGPTIAGVPVLVRHRIGETQVIPTNKELEALLIP